MDWRIELMASHDIVEFEFKDLRVPKENLLGPLGGGFKLAMQTLDLMRMSVGAAALGMAHTAMEPKHRLLAQKSAIRQGLSPSFKASRSSWPKWPLTSKRHRAWSIWQP